MLKTKWLIHWNSQFQPDLAKIKNLISKRSLIYYWKYAILCINLLIKKCFTSPFCNTIFDSDLTIKHFVASNNSGPFLSQVHTMHLASGFNVENFLSFCPSVCHSVTHFKLLFEINYFSEWLSTFSFEGFLFHAI